MYYAAHDIYTAVAETQFHRALLLAATNEPSIEIDMRSYASDIDAPLHTIRGLQTTRPDLYDADPARYTSAQAFAKRLRNDGSNGLVYNSVRHADGECIAVFRPRLMNPVVQGAHYCYVWNGERITDVYVKTEFR